MIYRFSSSKAALNVGSYGALGGHSQLLKLGPETYWKVVQRMQRKCYFKIKEPQELNIQMNCFAFEREGRGGIYLTGEQNNGAWLKNMLDELGQRKKRIAWARI